MREQLVIDVYFDLICPWCLIGKRHLDLAVAELVRAEPALAVALRWHCVQLLPGPARRRQGLHRVLPSAQGQCAGGAARPAAGRNGRRAGRRHGRFPARGADAEYLAGASAAGVCPAAPGPHRACAIDRAHAGSPFQPGRRSGSACHLASHRARIRPAGGDVERVARCRQGKAGAVGGSRRPLLRLQRARIPVRCAGIRRSRMAWAGT